MKQITVRIPEEMYNLLDKLVEAGWYKDRNEAIRDAIRMLAQNARERELI